MLEIQTIKNGFGADIINIDLKTVSEQEFERIYQAWLDYGVVRVRDQTLDDDDLQVFSQRFGPLETIPQYDKIPEEYKKIIKNKYVTIISNVKENGMPIGALGNTESKWHSDMTYIETPPPASVLLAEEIPRQGGDTWFANQHAAYEVLPADLKARIVNLSIKHDGAHNSVGELRPGFEAVASPRLSPGAIHPIVRTHSETGKKCLYLGRREWAYVVGLEEADSEALLDQLWQYAALEENVIIQNWCVGDLIMWDNRSVLHRRDDFDPGERRLLRRCQVLARV